MQWIKYQPQLDVINAVSIIQIKVSESAQLFVYACNKYCIYNFVPISTTEITRSMAQLEAVFVKLITETTMSVHWGLKLLLVQLLLAGLCSQKLVSGSFSSEGMHELPINLGCVATQQSQIEFLDGVNLQCMHRSPACSVGSSSCFQVTPNTLGAHNTVHVYADFCWGNSGSFTQV